MPYQVKPDPPVEPLHLDSMQTMFDTHKMLWDFGYRGGFTTTKSEADGVVTESGRFDLVMDDAVPVSAALGDVILYRLAPSPQVVACIPADEFTKNYEAV